MVSPLDASRKMWLTPLEKSSTSASQLEVSPTNTERNNEGRKLFYRLLIECFRLIRITG